MNELKKNRKPKSILLQGIRLKLAALISGGRLYQFEGLDVGGVWVTGPIILTKEGKRAMDASFRVGAKVYSDTALTNYK